MATKEDVLKELARRELLRREAQRKENVETGKIIRGQISKNIGETAKDIAVTAPMGPTFGFAPEIVGMFDEESGKKYDEAVKAARERSPYATFIGEEAALAASTLGAGSLLGKASKASKLIQKAEKAVPKGGSIGKTFSEGALMGAGEADGDMTDRVIQGGLTGAGGAALQVGGRLIKAPFKKPKAIKTRALGATKKQVQQKGVRDIEPALKSLEQKDIFNTRRVKWDPVEMRFIRSADGQDLVRGQELESVLNRANSAVDQSADEAAEILKSSTKSAQEVWDDADGFGKIIDNMEITKRKVSEPLAFEKMALSQLEELEAKVNAAETLVDLNDIKRSFQNDARKIYGDPNKTDMDINKAIFKRDIARALKEIVEQGAGPQKNRLKQLNKVQAENLVIGDVIADAIASKDAKGSRGNYFGGAINIIGQGLEAAGSTFSGQRARAGVAETAGKIPLRNIMEDRVRTGSQREFTRLLGDEGSLLSEMTEEAQATEIPMRPQGRSPQSTGMPMQAKVNFMLADTQIPRSTEWIKEHPNLVVGRLMQVAPELAAQVQIALDKGQDQILKKTLPLMAQQVPEIFEYDEYNSFDGKIIDPSMRQMYSEKVMNDDSLDMYQKAEIINHLNKTHEVLQ